MKKEVIKKINFNKSGTGGEVARVVLNKEWIFDMEIDKKNNEVIMTYDDETKAIKITKK